MIIIIIIAMMMPNIWIKVYLWVREALGDRWPRSLLCHGQNLFPFIIIGIQCSNTARNIYTASSYKACIIWLGRGSPDRDEMVDAAQLWIKPGSGAAPMLG